MKPSECTTVGAWLASIHSSFDVYAPSFNEYGYEDTVLLKNATEDDLAQDLAEMVTPSLVVEAVDSTIAAGRQEESFTDHPQRGYRAAGRRQHGHQHWNSCSAQDARPKIQ